MTVSHIIPIQIDLFALLHIWDNETREQFEIAQFLQIFKGTCYFFLTNPKIETQIMFVFLLIILNHNKRKNKPIISQFHFNDKHILGTVRPCDFNI